MTRIPQQRRLPVSTRPPTSLHPASAACLARLPLSLVWYGCLAAGLWVVPLQAQAQARSQAQAPDKSLTVEITLHTEQDKPTEVSHDGSKPPFSGTRPSVDVAILLDTSNSMDGLISQAKSQLWNIVRQFAEAKKNGQTPTLRVSVFEYGNTRLPAAEGYLRQVCGLTDDLDKVSEALFSLKTDGGDEYCAQVIQAALKRLDWSTEPNGYKSIFIAGNEPFSQGPVDFHDSCRAAIEAGVVVNTIHCGDRQAGINGQWEEGARLAEGEFMNIDQDRQIVHIRCPQDKLIIELNAKLNKTYLWYGDKRQLFGQNQLRQDSNAAAMSPEALVQRAAAKGSAAYSNVGRDLVDSCRETTDILSSVAVDDLPEEMRSLSLEERKSRVTELATQRASIQEQLARLSREREAYLAKERQKLSPSDDDTTLGDAFMSVVRKQLKSSGFDVKEQP